MKINRDIVLKSAVVSMLLLLCMGAKVGAWTHSTQPDRSPSPNVHFNPLNQTSAQLSLSKTVDTGGRDEVAPGDMITYTITLHNTSDTIASNVVLTDPLPTEVNSVDWLNQGSAILALHTIRWGPYDLEANAGYTFTFKTTLRSETLSILLGKTVTNTVYASADNAPSVSDTAYFDIVRYSDIVYLPLVTRNFTVSPPTLKERVTVHAIALPQPLAGSDSSWCTWTWCTLSPRLYHAPLNDGRTRIGWTDAKGDGHISTVGSDGNLIKTFTYPAQSVRGLVAHSDNTFALLLWDKSAKIMWLSKRNNDGSEIWHTNIDGDLTSFNPNVGDSRLTFGNNTYAAYFAVHGDSGWPEGHEGDQLMYINDDGSIQSGGWEWGCSHSMAELISYHPTLNKFAPICSSDCYASKGILANNNEVIFACDGDCRGLVSAQLGQIALSNDHWKLVFNALNRPGYEGKGIGFATMDENFQSTYVWLTNTNGEYERDPVIGRLGSDLDSDRYVVGWTTTDDDTSWLGIIDGTGKFITGPEDVSSGGITWGNRDDSFRTRADGQVSWVQGNPGSTTLKLFIFNGAGYVP